MDFKPPNERKPSEQAADLATDRPSKRISVDGGRNSNHNAAMLEPSLKETALDDLDADQHFRVNVLDEEYRRRYGAAVQYLKAEIGSGEVYENEVARVLVSPDGAWFECVDLPLEFSGSAGVTVRQKFLADADAIELLTGLHAILPSVAPENTRDFGLLALYDRTAVVNDEAAFAALWRPASPQPLRIIGAFQEGRLPRAFRAKLDTDLDTPPTVPARGLVYCLAGIGDRNLVITLGFGAEPVRDLGDPSLYGRMPQ